MLAWTMEYTRQVIAGMDYRSQDITGITYTSQVIAGIDTKGQVIAGMEYVSQVIANCFRAILQLLSQQFSQSDARNRHNFTSSGAPLRTPHMSRYDNTSHDIAGMDLNTFQVIAGIEYMSKDIAGMEYVT